MGSYPNDGGARDGDRVQREIERQRELTQEEAFDRARDRGSRPGRISHPGGQNLGGMMRVRVHERRQRYSDPAKAAFLSERAPRAFRKAQDVLAAAQKYVTGKGGWFSTERSRQNAIERELVALAHALKQDRWTAASARMEGDETLDGLVIDFLSQFSDAFPNWQQEYEAINRVLGR